MIDAGMMYSLASVLNTADLEEHEKSFVSRIRLSSDIKDALKVSRLATRSNNEFIDVIDKVNSNETWTRISSLMGEEEYKKMWKHKFVLYEFTNKIKIALNGRLTLEDKASSIGGNNRIKQTRVVNLSKGYNPRSLVDRKCRPHRRSSSDRNVMPTDFESVCSLIQNQETGVPCRNICLYISPKRTKMLRKFLRQDFKLESFRKKLNTNILQQNCSSIQIFPVVKTILESHVPRALIGSKKSFDRMTQNVGQVFATNPRYPLRLATLMKGLPFVSYHDNVFLCKFVLFLTNVFVSGVVFRLFYRTESLKNKRVLFFKRKMWTKYEENALKKMVDNGVLVQSSLVSYGPNVSKLRIFHKTKGFRPLVMSSSRHKTNRFRLSVCNTFLKQIVNQINPAYGHVLNTLHSQWSNIKPSKSNKLYFIRTDVSDAFLSISHTKLLEVLNRRVDALDPVQTCRTFEYRCGARKKSILQFTKISPRLNVEILFCEAGKKVYTTSYLKAVIIQYIKHNYLTLNGSKVFHQIKGLPQGCYLSSILCELYLTDMDDHYFNHLKGENDVLVRGADDYLYLTSDRQKAETFIKLICNGIEEYGIMFQHAKTTTNLGSPVTCFSFYGYIFYQQCRKVEPDFSEWTDITGRVYLNPKMTWYDLTKRMKMITHIKLHRLVVDFGYLHKFAVMKNIYLCSKIHAAKYKAIYNFLAENWGGSPPSPEESLIPIITASRVIARRVVSLNMDNNGFSHREVQIVTPSAASCSNMAFAIAAALCFRASSCFWMRISAISWAISDGVGHGGQSIVLLCTVSAVTSSVVGVIRVPISFFKPSSSALVALPTNLALLSSGSMVHHFRPTLKHNPLTLHIQLARWPAWG
ncbi:hypothetical protein GE061_017590 [Apolygus lucorum]|uniref:Telomerase reverse transcriptase n=1 Tax=Apolygus lucorum TaxID=248454 RepID=A0A8S9XBG4_APOLU|nr:hypothetical protein GE061_017590 [Apolygus lucorum]